MQHPKHHAQTKTIRDNPTSFEPVTLKPLGSTRISLGRYRDTEPEPQFDIHYEPALPHIISHEILKLPIGDSSYTLTSQVQSFHDEPVTVRVERTN